MRDRHRALLPLAVVDSRDALRKATATSYYKGKGSLWVKMVSTAEGSRRGEASLQASRQAALPDELDGPRLRGRGRNGFTEGNT